MKNNKRLTESDLTRIVRRVISENIGDRTSDLYSDINKLIDEEYSDIESFEIIEVLENILDHIHARHHREKNKIGPISKDQVRKNWGLN